MTAAVTALVLLTLAPAAGAQNRDPYGSTTTTTSSTVPGGSTDTRCSLSIDRGRPGDLVTATVSPVSPGAFVRILIDGEQVASGTAGAAVLATATGSPVQFNGAALPVQATPATSVTIAFRVPDIAVGDHSVTAVGANFTCFCNPDGIFTVLGKASSPASLARTGVYVALFLVAALFCFVLGRAFLRASHIARARAEAAAREAHRPRSLIDL